MILFVGAHYYVLMRNPKLKEDKQGILNGIGKYGEKCPYNLNSVRTVQHADDR